jgi:site-specific DNA recombinase
MVVLVIVVDHAGPHYPGSSGDWLPNPEFAPFRGRGQRILRERRRACLPFTRELKSCAAAKRQGEDDITEREVRVLLADFAMVWNELFPAEQARIVQLLVDRVDVQEDTIEVRIRAQGLASLVGELRQGDERTARAAG